MKGCQIEGQELKECRIEGQELKYVEIEAKTGAVFQMGF
jgi:hypothetical protein